MSPTIAAIIWGLAIAGWVAIRMPRRRKAKKTAVVDDRKSTMEQLALGLCIVGLVALPALQLATGLFNFANYTFQPVLAWAGLVVMIAFVWLFYLSHKQLARNWSVTLEVREDHQLVTSGLYNHMRHPMYTSFWLWAVGQALLLPNWIVGFSGLVAVAILYFSRINTEEEMMRAQFGAEYDAYCAKTPRLIPKLRF